MGFARTRLGGRRSSPMPRIVLACRTKTTSGAAMGRFVSVRVGVLCMVAGCAGAWLDMEIESVMTLLALGAALTSLGHLRRALRNVLVV